MTKKTNIKSITVVTNQGVNEYVIGQEVNGLVIDRILDNSREYADGIDFIFDGLTSDNESVFTVINAPVDIQYEMEEKLTLCHECKKPRGEDKHGASVCPCPHCGDIIPF